MTKERVERLSRIFGQVEYVNAREKIFSREAKKQEGSAGGDFGWSELYSTILTLLVLPRVLGSARLGLKIQNLSVSPSRVVNRIAAVRLSSTHRFGTPRYRLGKPHLTFSFMQGYYCSFIVSTRRLRWAVIIDAISLFPTSLAKPSSSSGLTV